MYKHTHTYLSEGSWGVRAVHRLVSESWVTATYWVIRQLCRYIDLQPHQSVWVESDTYGVLRWVCCYTHAHTHLSVTPVSVSRIAATGWIYFTIQSLHSLKYISKHNLTALIESVNNSASTATYKYISQYELCLLFYVSSENSKTNSYVTTRCLCFHVNVIFTSDNWYKYKIFCSNAVCRLDWFAHLWPVLPPSGWLVSWLSPCVLPHGVATKRRLDFRCSLVLVGVVTATGVSLCGHAYNRHNI